MATSKSAWTRRERESARMFGAERQVGSGSGGRKDQTRSDSTSPTLFIETKLRASTAVRKLWDQTAELARRESKTPVVVLFDKHKKGGIVCIHQDHLAEVLAELVAFEATTDEGGDDEQG